MACSAFGALHPTILNPRLKRVVAVGAEGAAGVSAGAAGHLRKRKRPQWNSDPRGKVGRWGMG